ncbi:hypothetical protein Hanom_Chr04g00337631 [Helianthus anomalus]
MHKEIGRTLRTAQNKSLEQTLGSFSLLRGTRYLDDMLHCFWACINQFNIGSRKLVCLQFKK